MSSSLKIQMDFESFLEMFRKQKTGPGSEAEITNTRITDESRGGTYSIPESEYARFLDVYYREVILAGKKDSLTEAQLANDGPCLVDLDFRFPYDCVKRSYTRDHIDDLVGAYLEEFKRIFQFDGDSKFAIYVLEKPSINRVQDKNITKDGIHLVIGIQSERKLQVILRRRMIKRLSELWSGDDALPITNEWEDVVDQTIALGRTGWQLYGSAKPGCAAYALTYIYDVGYDACDGELTVNVRSMQEEMVDMKEVLPRLSARFRGHPQFFYRAEFARELAAEPDVKRATKAGVCAADLAAAESMVPGAGVSARDNLYVLSIQTRDMLDQVVAEFVASITETDPEWVETYECTMALPEQYFGQGSYSKWLRVGWMLRNMSNRLLIVWVAFSAKSSEFSFSTDVPDLYERWSKFDMGNPNGLTKRSLMYWCRTDAPTEYREIRKRSTDYLIDRTLGHYEETDEDARFDRKGTTDYDIASVLYHMYRDTYVCVSFSNNLWYRYEEPRWRKMDAGAQLRMVISNELRKIYSKKAAQYLEMRTQMNDVEDAYRIKKLSKFIDKLLGVCSRLGQSSDKKNIMTEAKELFYDESFVEKLDVNPYLLCFKNGVVDFKAKNFRRGMPEDYLTKCTNINYIPIDDARDAAVMADIRDFMRKLFPEADIHDYMWEHLAATLIGMLPDQTWNMYIGDGQNGKSLLVILMGHVLGEYKGSVATNLITDKRTKIGGTATELVCLKGIRYAVMQEPEKGEQVNEGVMKQLTSGMDTIEARGLYRSEMDVFKPQFKLVLCSNYLMNIKSNDHGTWRRIRVVPFKSLFTESPVDGDHEKPYQFKIDYTLEERCVEWKEVFASMLVNITYRNQGKTTDCPSVLAASNAYRESQDYIAEFIADRLVLDASGVISKTELSQEFKVWYDSTYGRGSPNIKEVQAYMDKKFKKCATRKVWVGARMNYDTDIRAGGGGYGDDGINESDYTNI